jgi:hypothetical protein
MLFQILERPDSPSTYRGVARYGPRYRDGEPEDSAFNRAWREWIDKDEVVSDLDDALRLAAVFNTHGALFDVVGISRDAQAQGAKVLGYDVASNGRESILSWGIRWEAARKATAPLGPLLALLELHFRPMLNQHGLFDNHRAADFFRDVLLAMQTLSPGVWEAPGHYHPEVLAICAPLLVAAG